MWTGKDDKTLRKLTLDVDVAVPAEARKRAGGLSTGTLAVSLLIADLNADQTITAPAGAKPLSDLTQALGATSGGGAGTSTTPSATTPTAPTAGATPEYLDCVQKAGQDLSKVQKCAELLGG